MYEGNQIGTLDLCSVYENCIQVMIMSENYIRIQFLSGMLHGLLGGKILCTLKKSSELSFSPVYNETTVTNGYMDHTYIEKNFLIDLLSLNSASTEQVYIFSGFLQSELLRLLRVPCPPFTL